MGPLGFSVDQLMELAGLACATALASEYPASTHRRVLVIAGPGNNGGDGLVAARHLYHFGYSVQVWRAAAQLCMRLELVLTHTRRQVCYPKQTDKPLYHGLVKQLQSLRIPLVPAEQLLEAPLAEQADVVMDAIFGFSFHGDPRPPFDSILDRLRCNLADSPVTIDLVNGWDIPAAARALHSLLYPAWLAARS